MARHSYKTALRAKGIRPIPPHHKLRSYRGNNDGKQHIIGAVNERPVIDFGRCRGDTLCRCRCCKPGRVTA